MAVLFTDDFNRADLTNLGANYSEVGAGASFNIVSNTCTTSGSSSDFAAYVNTILLPDNQRVDVTLPTVHADGIGAGYGVICRASGTHLGSNGTYLRTVGNGSGYAIHRFSGGLDVETIISTAAVTFASGDKLGMSWEGSVWVLWKNGSNVASGSNSNLLTGSRGGVGYSSTSNAADNIDDLILSDLSASLPIKIQPVKLRPAPFRPGIAR